MNSDLIIYWVEDTPTWSNSILDTIKYELQDNGISVKFITESDATTAKAEMANHCRGFKKYDLFFIDFNISSDITGEDIVLALRKHNVDVDILFYSANNEKQIRENVAAKLSEFEGVYIANRNTFAEKALNLIEKNSRKLLSLQNIRGKLMDSTSDNDFVINSYILEKYIALSSEQKNRINQVVIDYLKNNVEKTSEKINEECTSIYNNGIKNINAFMKLPSYIVPLELKYVLFTAIAECFGENPTRFNGYFSTIVKKRNILAHKKLEICDSSDRITYSDTLRQYKERECDNNCNQCDHQYSITVDEWKSIRKQANVFSMVFDGLLSQIE